MHKLLNDSSTAQELIATGREEGLKEEALRMTRVALKWRFGRLDSRLSQALEQADVVTLEEVAFDPTLSLKQLYARLDRRPEAAPRVGWAGIRGQGGKPTRLSPLGGYRHS
ncbi:MAG TPA: hypothetical protein VKT82_25030 [Ktedonobacterales bacterium]|nr:hypothetical protein [Ktedonobacterales bacterium]